MDDPSPPSPPSGTPEPDKTASWSLVGLFLFGAAVCAAWPVVLGLQCCSRSGVQGMVVGLLASLPMALALCRRRPMRMTVLALGLVIVGSLSLVPVIPLVIGGLCLRLTRALFGLEWDLIPSLDFTAALVATLLMAGHFVLLSYGVGAVTRWLVAKATGRAAVAARHEGGS